MATLTIAWQIVATPAHQPFRDQVSMAMWSIARAKHAAGLAPGPQRDMVTRVLRGDQWPIDVAIRAAATDTVAQDAYVAGGNKLADSAVLTWLTNAWPSLAGIAGN